MASFFYEYEFSLAYSKNIPYNVIIKSREEHKNFPIHQQDLLIDRTKKR